MREIIFKKKWIQMYALINDVMIPVSKKPIWTGSPLVTSFMPK